MNLERRISDALHAADQFEPSVDLFDRLHRSIEEDAAHRRRVHINLGWISVSVLALALFIRSLLTHNAAGEVAIPKWGLVTASTSVTIVILLALGPVLRRFGEPLLADVFHLRVETGQRFTRLLEIAYYLFFGGTIITNIDITAPSTLITVTSSQMWQLQAGVGGFLLQLGTVHMFNLAVLPLIGLLFTSLTRRARRHAAGLAAPAVSAEARKADRIATTIVIVAVALAVVGTLSLIGFVMLGLGLP